MTSLLRHNFRLSYVDFPPHCSSSDDALCSPQYEKFYSLMGRANEWLRDHPGLKVVTCETIKVKVHTSGKVVTSRSCYFKYDQTKKRFRNVYVKALRLWVTPRKDEENVSMQIGYVNLVPSRNVQTPFDSISETIVRFNDYLKVHPIPGEVLNIETDELKFHDLGFGGNDADECCWIESTLLSLTQLNFIRVYFHLGPPTLETIGCVDFLPSKVNRESKFDALVFEDFRSVVSMATAWVRQQRTSEPSLRVTNMQTMEYKLRTPSCHHHDHHHPFNTSDDADTRVEINSQQSYFNNCNRHSNRSFRFLRLYFTRRIHSPATLPSSSGVTFTFDYMTFEPRLLSYGGIFGVPLFETLVQTMRRAMLWMEQLDADVDVLAAETIPVRLVPRSDVARKERMKKKKRRMMRMKKKTMKEEQTSKQNRREEDSDDDVDDDDDCQDGCADEDDDGRRWNDSVAMETDDETGVKWILGDGKNEFCLFLLRFYFNVDLSKLKRRHVDLSPAFQSDSTTAVENAGSAASAERPFYATVT